MSTPITLIECEEANGFFTFFNFVEYPPTNPDDPAPMLYFSLGFKLNESGFGLMINDMRLKNGRFQNPYHLRRAHAYFSEPLAKLVHAVWDYFVAPQMPKWRTHSEAWLGLVADQEKLGKAIHAPYKVFDPSKVRERKAPKTKKVNFL